MVRFGTCAPRSPMSRMFSLSSVSGVNAVTATGTSCRVSSRLRAVTVMESNVVAWWPAAGCCCSSACTNAAGASNAKPTAMLRYLRFIGLPPPGYDTGGGVVGVWNAAMSRTLTGCRQRAYRPFVQWAAPARLPILRGNAMAGEPRMSFLIVLAALCFLMYVAYRGHSVILFAPVAALGAVLLTDPSLVQPMFTGLFMDKMV